MVVMLACSKAALKTQRRKEVREAQKESDSKSQG